jgi:hypothetical protein
MKKIAEIEKAEKNETLEQLNINWTFYRAYEVTQRRENKYLDFHDVIWDREIDEVFENLQRFGIKTFTISNSSSGLQRTLAAFCEKGCKIAGIVKVNGCKSWRADGFELENAIKMQMPR